MKRLIFLILLIGTIGLPIVSAEFVYFEDSVSLYAVNTHSLYTIEITDSLNLGGCVDVLNYGSLKFLILDAVQYSRFVNETSFVPHLELEMTHEGDAIFWNSTIPGGIDYNWKFVCWKVAGNNEKMNVEYAIWNWEYYPITNTTTTTTNTTNVTTTMTTSNTTSTSTTMPNNGSDIDYYIIGLASILGVVLIAAYILFKPKKFEYGGK